ncbi:hypothetical protein ACIGHB_28695, partial [Streptomyces sp. NPDC085460]
MPLLGGIRPPIAVLCVLLLALAGLTAKILGPTEDAVAPQAVLSSQRYFAEDGAIALRASIDERVADLERTAAALNAGRAVKPGRVLSDLGRTYQKWTGTTVVDLESGEVGGPPRGAPPPPGGRPPPPGGAGGPAPPPGGGGG